jgi:hypothetical protein
MKKCNQKEQAAYNLPKQVNSETAIPECKFDTSSAC